MISGLFLLIPAASVATAIANTSTSASFIRSDMHWVGSRLDSMLYYNKYYVDICMQVGRENMSTETFEYNILVDIYRYKKGKHEYCNF